MPQEESNDVEMKDKEIESPNPTANGGEETMVQSKAEKRSKEEGRTVNRVDRPPAGGQKDAFRELTSKPNPKEEAEGGSKVTDSDNAVESSAERETSTPSTILEKGIIYFFERGRVGVGM